MRCPGWGLVCRASDKLITGAPDREDQMAKFKKSSVGRRGFLKGAAAGAAALVAKPPALLEAQQQQPARTNGGARPNPTTLAADTAPAPADDPETRLVDNPGSDYMVDVLKSLNIEYIASNP